MKQLTRCLTAIIFVAPSLVSAATDEMRSDPTRGKHLLDCGAFFGVLSQSKSEISEAMKVFAFAAASYATVEFANERQVEIETAKSTALLADELPRLQQNQEALKGKLETCVSVLKAAEVEIRPRMDEMLKTIVQKSLAKVTNDAPTHHSGTLRDKAAQARELRRHAALKTPTTCHPFTNLNSRTEHS